MLEKIFKCTEKRLIVFPVSVAAEPVIPFNSGSQRASRNVGRPNENIAVVFIMENVGFRVKRSLFFIIKAKIHNGKCRLSGGTTSLFHYKNEDPLGRPTYA